MREKCRIYKRGVAKTPFLLYNSSVMSEDWCFLLLRICLLAFVCVYQYVHFWR